MTERLGAAAGRETGSVGGRQTGRRGHGPQAAAPPPPLQENTRPRCVALHFMYEINWTFRLGLVDQIKQITSILGSFLVLVHSETPSLKSHTFPRAKDSNLKTRNLHSSYFGQLCDNTAVIPTFTLRISAWLNSLCQT